MLGEPGVREVTPGYTSKLPLSCKYSSNISDKDQLLTISISRTNENKSGLKSNYTVSFEAGSVG